MVLHGNKLRVPVLLRNMLQSRELIRPHGTGTEVSNFARSHQVMERPHRFLRVNRVVVAVDLEDVKIGRTETLKRRIDRVKYCTSR
jgi:hypothetical protein